MNANEAATTNAFDRKRFAKNLLSALGSLRITVFLLALGLILVLIATLQQTRRDIYQVKQQHFRAPVVYVPFQEMLIPAWFPELQDVGGGFLMPSGVTVLVAMLLNLLFAHTIRFRIQARGPRLLAGSLILLLGLLVTLGVILFGNARGFQETPVISWERQWLIFKLVLAGGGIAGLLGGWTLGSSVRRTFSLAAGVILTTIAAFLFYQGSSTYIGDDAMRVVWRLVQGSLAAIVCYLGALLVFKRKAGIVVIHTGLLLLMIGELYTTYSATEQRMFFFEGETTRHTFNVDEVEMSVATAAADGTTENVVTIPVRQLAADGALSVEQVPFNIQTLAWYPNAAVFRKTPGETTLPGERGLAGFFMAEERAAVAGTSMDEINMAAAYVRLIDRTSGEDLGTYLISQSLYQDKSYDLDTVSVDGQEYRIGLRFKHYYKPYSVQLNSTTRTDYTGTSTPQTYASQFRIVDPDNNIDEIKDVSMNRPLRYNNETFYQAGHDTDPATGRKWSVLQVVRNTGWMIPYVSCAMVGIGLLLHFLSIFIRFVEKLTASRSPVLGYDRISWACVIGFVLLFAMWGARKIEKPATLDTLELSQFGKLPVAFGGRVQPVDSVARSTLRQLRKYEIPVRLVDGEEEEMPPIRWLADWVYAVPDSENYRIFKIDHPEVVSALALVRRKSHLYSMAEVELARDELEKYASAARLIAQQNKSLLTVFQKKIMQLSEHVELVRGLRYAFSNPADFGFDDPVKTLETVMALEKGLNLPLAVPGENAGDWSVASLRMVPQWIQGLCDRYETRNAVAVASGMIDEAATEKIEQRVFRNELARQFVEFSEVDPASISPEQLNRLVDRMLDDPDPELQDRLERIRRIAAPRIEAVVQMRKEAMAGDVARAMGQYVPVVNGQFDFGELATPLAITELPAAYRDRDGERFADAIDRYQASISGAPDVADHQGQVRWEHRYNLISPLYLATAVYIGALLLAFASWLLLVGVPVSDTYARWANGVRRAAFWVLVLAFVIHTVGLVMRIYISGRPPVTNLYSSAVFIGWIGALIGIISERIVRYGFGTVIGSSTGCVCLIVSFALGADGDTMSVLQAVLDTQFWLSTHVVTITIGYATTLGAGILGILYLATSILIPADLSEVRKILAKMVYGVTCLALFFSFVGTVLGGLWADDSWGRFWGWDPKENGALMIVLVNAVLLHARWAGLVRDRGMAVLAICGNIVTLWSWFAVNELGIGLHTYGLTEGRMAWVGKTWLAHLAVILAAAIPARLWLGNRAARRQS